MVNTEMLRERIRSSGYKLGYVAEKCGLSYAGLHNKLCNGGEFRVKELKALKDLLGLTDEDMGDIFFA